MLRYIVIVILFLLTLVGIPEGFQGLPYMVRCLTYSFFHVNVFHFLANALSLWFLLSPGRKHKVAVLVTAYIVAVLVYPCALKPILGVSNVIFAMVGIGTSNLKPNWYKDQSWIVFFAVNVIMLAIPNVSAITHILSFVVGIGIAYIVRLYRRLDYDVKRIVG